MLTRIKDTPNRENTFNIKVTAEDGRVRDCTLKIIKQSANVEIEKIVVAMEEVVTSDSTDAVVTNRVEENAVLKEDGKYYVKMPRENTASVKVTLSDKNASVKIKNNAFEIGESTRDVETMQERTEVLITVKAEDGTLKEYTLVIEKKSSDTEIKEITGPEIQKIEGKTIYVDESVKTVTLTIVTRNDSASIKLSKETGYELNQITRTINLESADIVINDEGKILIEVDVKAEDGTIETHVIKIGKILNAKIKGKILTENFEGKHKSKISIYKKWESTPYKEVETGEDGTFVVGVAGDIYRLEVTKAGYLSHKVENIYVEGSSEVTIDEYKLIAGDVTQNGEINIDDLVTLNENYGKEGVFDLNEDGKVDDTDRTLLKQNYGKQSK